MSPMATLRTWGEMIKFSHSIFALPFALMATFLAARDLPGGLPNAGHIALIIACMVAARSFAMTFNRIADAAIDAANPRTENRPIPAGRITIRQAWLFLITSAGFFIVACFGFAWFYDNPWPVRLCVPTLVALAGYSYAKRVTAAAHFILGLAIAFAPTAAWIAINPSTLGWPTLLLTGAVLFWIAGFDIIYACQDYDVDRRVGLFSLPARLGIGRALVVSRACHVLTIVLLIWLGSAANLGWIYASAVGVTALLLLAEQSVVRANDLSRVNLAFFTLNGCVSLILGAAAIADMLLTGRP